jgi:integrase
MRLTDTAVRALPLPDRGAKVHYDDSLTGFGVRVTASGVRAFVLTYGTQRERRTLGRYPLISLQEARSEAKRLLAEQTLGKHRPARLKASEALSPFLAEKQAKNKASSLAITKGLINNHFPALLRKNLEDVRTDDVTDVTDKLLRQEQPGAAVHAFVAIRTFLRWCVKRRYLHHSPIEGLDLPAKRGSRNRVLSDDELCAIWCAAEELGGNFGDIVKVLILTGQRRTEIGSLDKQWCTLPLPPFSNAIPTICLPSELTKNHREHTIPISARCAAILRSNITEATTLLFPARGRLDRAFNGWSKGKPLLDKLVDKHWAAISQSDRLFSHWTLHDLRRTFVTNLQRLKVTLEVREALINHISGGSHTGSAGTYNRYAYWDEMLEATQTYDTWLQCTILDMRNDEELTPIVAQA